MASQGGLETSRTRPCRGAEAPAAQSRQCRQPSSFRLRTRLPSAPRRPAPRDTLREQTAICERDIAAFRRTVGKVERELLGETGGGTAAAWEKRAERARAEVARLTQHRGVMEACLKASRRQNHRDFSPTALAELEGLKQRIVAVTARIAALQEKRVRAQQLSEHVTRKLGERRRRVQGEVRTAQPQSKLVPIFGRLKLRYAAAVRGWLATQAGVKRQLAQGVKALARAEELTRRLQMPLAEAAGGAAVEERESGFRALQERLLASPFNVREVQFTLQAKQYFEQSFYVQMDMQLYKLKLTQDGLTFIGVGFYFLRGGLKIKKVFGRELSLGLMVRVRERVLRLHYRTLPDSDALLFRDADRCGGREATGAVDVPTDSLSRLVIGFTVDQVLFKLAFFGS